MALPGIHIQSELLLYTVRVLSLKLPKTSGLRTFLLFSSSTETDEETTREPNQRKSWNDPSQAFQMEDTGSWVDTFRGESHTALLPV
jgi:hypothetical protein